jgi:hypothetical protein
MVDIYEEVRLIADLGFDFIDLTLEPEETFSATVDVKRLRWPSMNSGGACESSRNSAQPR